MDKIITKHEQHTDVSNISLLQALHEVIRDKLENTPNVPNPIEVLKWMRYA